MVHTCSIQPSEALELSYGAPPRALVHDVSARGVPYRRAKVPVLRQVHLKVRVVVKLPHPQGWASCCFMHLRYCAVRKATRCGILRVTKIQFISTFIWTIKTKIKFNHFTIACVVPLPSQLQMQYVIFKPDNLILYDMDFQHANLFTQISFISDRMPTRHNLSAWQGHSTIVYRLIEITRWAT